MADPRPAARRRAASFLPLAAVLLAAACGDGGTAPVAAPREPVSLEWNARARDFVARYAASPPTASRIYAMLGVAQDSAVRDVDARVAASDAAGRAVAERAAVTAASARVLTAAFPVEGTLIAAQLERERDALVDDDATLHAVTLGEETGRRVADAVLAGCATDGSDLAWTGTQPTDPHLWFGTPQQPNWAGVRPWVMSRPDQFRAAPPPLPGSIAYRRALQELRTISADRTDDELAIARFWADGGATSTPPGHWNAIASALLASHPIGEAASARLLATMNIAIADAFIACWDSKYTYWVKRPWQVDPSITTPVGQPSHPSYPSGHSCGSSAAATVLAARFPAERDSLLAMAREAGLSRIYAGIHFRFDTDAGAKIGEQVAALALEKRALR